MTTYTNPVRYVDGRTRTNPDPFVTRFAGTYWCYSTDETGVNVSRSDDMVNWQCEGKALEDPTGKHFWAPCVVYADGRFWMYVSWRPAGSDDPHDEHLRVLVSDRPEGPYAVVEKLFDTFSIDADVTRDPATGDWLLFYSTNDVTGLDRDGTGTSILVDRLVDMSHLEGNPRPVVVPTLEQEIFQRNRFGDGRDWYTIEGATFFERRGISLMTYSGNAYVGTDYFIGYSRSTDSGPILDRNWHKFPDDHTWGPLVRRGNGIEGTGHNSIVRAPNLVDDWIVYHGRDEAIPLDPDVEQRVMRIDPIRLDGDRLQTPAPTSTPQRVPAGPTLHDDMSEPTDTWLAPCAPVEHVSDEDSWIPGFLRTGRELEVDLLADHTCNGFVAEVWLRMHRSDAGARAGVIISAGGTDGRLDLTLDAATRTVALLQTRNNLTRTVVTAPLHADPSEEWRLLEVERTLGSISVKLDGLHILEADTAFTADGRPGLMSTGTRTDFAAFTLTNHLDLSGTRLGRYLPLLVHARSCATIRETGVVGPPATPLTLEALTLRTGWAQDFDLDLRSTSGRAVFEIGGTDGITAAVLELGGGEASLTTSDGSGSGDRLSAPLTGIRTTARLVLGLQGIHVEVGDARWDIPSTATGLHVHRLVLHGTVLRGVEMTQIEQN